MAASTPKLFSKSNDVTIDTHAHVFTRDLPQIGGRYNVDYDAPISAYLEMLDAHGMTNGVVVQPSFLGTDNSYLLTALEQNPERLRGIVVVPPTIEYAALLSMARLGVVGVRLNLLGKSDPELSSPILQNHLESLAKLDWQVEIQAEAHRLPNLLPPLLKRGINVVIDHLGRPDPEQGIDDPGFQYLLSNATSRRIWVKLSGYYRIAPTDPESVVADQAARSLLAAFGPDRLLYGSDWPHTQFEKLVTPTMARARFDRWVPNVSHRRQILDDTAAELFRFKAGASRAGEFAVGVG